MRLILAGISLLAILESSVTLAAAPWERPTDRAGTWELSGQLLFIDSESATGDQGAAIDVDSSVGFGFGATYNFSNRLALGFDMQFASPGYEATIIEEDGGERRIDTEADFFAGQLRGTWNILDRALTPYVEGGIGWTYVDSNIIDGIPSTGCWWDPWWGYICAPFYSTYDDTSFAWSLGLGLRWEISREWLLRGGYTWLNIDVGGSSGDPELGIGRVEAVWRF